MNLCKWHSTVVLPAMTALVEATAGMIRFTTPVDRIRLVARSICHDCVTRIHSQKVCGFWSSILSTFGKSVGDPLNPILSCPVLSLLKHPLHVIWIIAIQWYPLLGERRREREEEGERRRERGGKEEGRESDKTSQLPLLSLLYDVPPKGFSFVQSRILTYSTQCSGRRGFEAIVHNG